MKRYIFLSIATLVSFALLAGCMIVEEKKIMVTEEKVDADTFSKAQKIVVHDAAGNEKATLTEQADIDAFVDTMSVNGWKFSELPEGLTEAGSFTLWQTEPITALLGEREAKVNEICTFRIYKDADYLTIETGVIDLPFSVPQETADYLRELAA